METTLGGLLVGLYKKTGGAQRGRLRGLGTSSSEESIDIVPAI